jgi:sulfonate transport system substrate-binding protein
MTLRRVITTLASLALICLLAGACRKTEKPPLTEITIGTFSEAIDYSPYYVARYFKWFEGAPELKGVTVNYKEFTDRAAISTALSRNELAAIFAAEAPLIITRAQGEEIRIPVISCTLQQEVVVRTALPVGSVADLRQKRVAVLQGTSSHYGLLRILASAGLSPNDVDLRFMGPPQARAAFESGNIDAWAVWPPFVEQEQISGRGKILRGGDAVIQSVMAEPKSLIDDHHAQALALVRVVNQAKKWIQENPEEAQAIVAKQLNLELPVVKAAWGKHNWGAQLNDAVTLDMQHKAEFLARQNATRSGTPLNVAAELVTKFEAQ